MVLHVCRPVGSVLSRPCRSGDAGISGVRPHRLPEKRQMPHLALRFGLLLGAELWRWAAPGSPSPSRGGPGSQRQRLRGRGGARARRRPQQRVQGQLGAHHGLGRGRQRGAAHSAGHAGSCLLGGLLIGPAQLWSPVMSLSRSELPDDGLWQAPQASCEGSCLGEAQLTDWCMPAHGTLQIPSSLCRPPATCPALAL